MAIKNFLLLCIILLLSGCVSSKVSNNLIVPDVIQLSFTKTASSLTWIEDDLFAYRHRLEEERNRTYIEIVDFSGQIHKQSNFNNNSGCAFDSVGVVDKLPDGRLGFIYECRDKDLFLVEHLLVAWDYQKDSYETLFVYPRPDHPTGFSVSPDMKFVLQEFDGDGIFNQLYLIDLDTKNMEQVSPHTKRAGYPNWYHFSNNFAYAVSKEGAKKTTNIFSSIPSLRSQLYSPWKIALSSVDELDPLTFPHNVKGLGFVKVSPTDNQIALTGEYKNQFGIWLYDVDRKTITLLFSDPNSVALGFSWSPNGDKILLQNCTRQNGGSFSEMSCSLLMLNLNDG